MKIERLIIENFKSIERIELIQPNPFTVFVGPNGSGKSNIFEALEFVNLAAKTNRGTVESLFGGKEYFLNRKAGDDTVRINIELSDSYEVRLVQRPNLSNHQEYTTTGTQWGEISPVHTRDVQQLVANFSRLFVGQDKRKKLNLDDDFRLTLSADNLENVLKRVLSEVVLRDEIFEWLELFVPEFKSVEVVESPFSGEETLLWYEQHADKPFTRKLISDGTYNILALLTAIYQSEKPQFLCIEEPEIGLHPEVIMTLVDFFRQQCEEKGHYIWLNTHSESVVKKLATDEIVLVEKKQGATQIRQIKGRNIYDIPTDDAWLTGALGGGLPW